MRKYLFIMILLTFVNTCFAQGIAPVSIRLENVGNSVISVTWASVTGLSYAFDVAVDSNFTTIANGIKGFIGTTSNTVNLSYSTAEYKKIPNMPAYRFLIGGLQSGQYFIRCRVLFGNFVSDYSNILKVDIINRRFPIQSPNISSVSSRSLTLNRNNFGVSLPSQGVLRSGIVPSTISTFSGTDLQLGIFSLLSPVGYFVGDSAKNTITLRDTISGLRPQTWFSLIRTSSNGFQESFPAYFYTPSDELGKIIQTARQVSYYELPYNYPPDIFTINTVNTFQEIDSVLHKLAQTGVQVDTCWVRTAHPSSPIPESFWIEKKVWIKLRALTPAIESKVRQQGWTPDQYPVRVLPEESFSILERIFYYRFTFNEIKTSVLSLNPNNSTEQLSCFPQPAVNTVTIKYASPYDGLLRLSLYNNLGQKIRQIDTANVTRGLVQQFFLDTHTLISGIYFIQAEITSQNFGRQVKTLPILINNN
jgi:hypothetical protein